MSIAKWLVAFLLVVLMSVPTYAVQLTLGGFPSFMRTRAHFISNATFISAISDSEAQALGFNDADDNIQFVDTRLRLTPQLVLSDNVTIRAQVDVADNLLWGGENSVLLRDVVFSSLSPNDRFRGALLTTSAHDVRFSGLLGTPTAVAFGPQHTATDDVQYFNVRMMHMDIVLPGNWGFLRVGRQPFDWGLGILANGGWDPNSDLGFVLDRFLYLKSWGLADGTFTFIFVSDKFRQGTSLVNGSGDGYDIGAIALVYNVGNLTIGAYTFPYIHQTNLAGTDINVNYLWLSSGLIDYKTDNFRLVGEVQQAFGELTGLSAFTLAGNDSADIDPTNIIAVARVEFYPGWPVKMFGIEGGWANGDEIDPINDGGDFQGNIIAFSSAYNVDQLLFRHILPGIYGLENSVINAFYGRAWATVKLMDNVSLTPQVLVAWNDETQALVEPNFFPGSNGEVSRYLGTEVEATLSIELVPGVNLDFMGSLVITGSGLEDLFEQRAAIEVDPTGATSPANFDGDNVPWAVQTRLMVYIDQFFK